MHWLFPVVALGLILRVALQKDPRPFPEGAWIDMAVIVGILALSVLLHEFGHCFGARLVDGDANEILIWPLGGLAYCDVPHTPRANFITVAAGPLVNVVLCIGSVLGFLMLTNFALWPPLKFWEAPLRLNDLGEMRFFTWEGAEQNHAELGVLLLARFFWVNWLLLLVNLLPGFPMDGGRLVQCLLWPRYGFRQAMLTAIFVGFIAAIVVGLAAITLNELMVLCLALFIFVTCWQQRIFLEQGGEDSLFGYDFSQGYTSLERGDPVAAPRRRRQTWWQRWKQQRATRRMIREQEQREAEERRMDELLEKVQQFGLSALSEEERRFLKRVSDKYRNRP